MEMNKSNGHLIECDRDNEKSIEFFPHEWMKIIHTHTTARSFCARSNT